MGKGNWSKIDNLSIVVIPKSIRKSLNIEHNDEIFMYVESENLIISKVYQNCGICESKDIKFQIGKKFVCFKCFEDIKDL